MHRLTQGQLKQRLGGPHVVSVLSFTVVQLGLKIQNQLVTVNLMVTGDLRL